MPTQTILHLGYQINLSLSNGLWTYQIYDGDIPVTKGNAPLAPKEVTIQNAKQYIDLALA